MGGRSWRWAGEVVTAAEVVPVLFSIIAGTVCGVWAFVLATPNRWAVWIGAGVALLVSAFVMAASAGWGVS